MSGPLLPDDVTQKEIELRETIRHILDARGSKSLTMTALYNMMTVEYARGVAEERARCVVPQVVRKAVQNALIYHKLMANEFAFVSDKQACRVIGYWLAALPPSTP